MKNDFDKKIDGRFEAIEECIKYQLDTMCEVLSTIQTIRYLLYLRNNDK